MSRVMNQFKEKLKVNQERARIKKEEILGLGEYKIAIDNLKDRRCIREINDILKDLRYTNSNIKPKEKIETSKVSDCMFDLFCTRIDQYTGTIHLRLC